ncbi:hypothetical protein ACLIR7_07260 [Nitratireductor aquimarinus]|uniref:hypothetical protein n=1 Tax=Nitratireductor aquimarinus TaxID=889300 RepID=UPI00398F4064
MATNRYLPEDRYDALIEALLQVRPTIMQPDLKSAFVEVLGEVGGIWPAFCRDEAENPHLRRRNFV